ncbi:MAG: SIS domain-containing protein [SAR202 cluster bacterium]|nr:SIS domain-containing protein [SAR202 cluster bacterium]
MNQQTAMGYLETLSNCMLTTEVTDRQGASLTLDEGSDLAVQMILETRANNKKIMLAGNGGSSAVVSHVQNDLCKAVGVKALVFTEQPLLTAFANDEGYGSVFEKPIDLWAEDGDLLFTVSSSGKSENIIRGLKSSQNAGCRIVTFSGFGADNPSRQVGDLNFYVDSGEYGFVETAHAALLHFMTDQAKAIIATDPNAEVN